MAESMTQSEPVARCAELADLILESGNLRHAPFARPFLHRMRSGPPSRLSAEEIERAYANLHQTVRTRLQCEVYRAWRESVQSYPLS